MARRREDFTELVSNQDALRGAATNRGSEMQSIKHQVLFAIICGAAVSSGYSTVATAADAATYVIAAGKFQACGPDIPGCEHIMYRGDPANGAFQKVYRMKKGFEFVKHWHTAAENLVMIKGTVVLNTEGGKEQKLRPGDYVHIPASLVHWGVCPEECIFYLGVEGADSFNVVEK